MEADSDIEPGALRHDDVPYSARIYRDANSLNELQDLWASAQVSVSGDLDFFRTVVCESPDVVRPHVVALFQGDQPRSLLLGRIERRGLILKIGYKKLSTRKINILVIDDTGWLKYLSKDASTAALNCLSDALRAREVDAINLQYMDDSSAFYQLVKFSRNALTRDHFPTAHALWRRCLEKDALIFDALSSKQRTNYRRQGRRMSEEFNGEIRITSYTEESEIEELMCHAESVAKMSYQRGLGVGYKNDQSMKERLTFLAKHGLLHATVLYVRDRACAFWITSLFKGVLYSDYLAFDASFAKFGPGSYLVVKTLMDVCDNRPGRRVALVDFGPGEAEWKSLLGNERHVLISLYLFGPSIRMTAINIVRSGFCLVDRLAGTTLARAGLLARVKRAWRRRATKSTTRVAERENVES